MALRICWLNMDTFIVIDIFQKSDVNCKKRTMTISRATAKYTVLSSAKKQSSGKKGVFFLTFVLNVLTSRIFSLWKEKQSPEKLCGSDRNDFTGRIKNNMKRWKYKYFIRYFRPKSEYFALWRCWRLRISQLRTSWHTKRGVNVHATSEINKHKKYDFFFLKNDQTLGAKLSFPIKKNPHYW